MRYNNFKRASKDIRGILIQFAKAYNYKSTQIAPEMYEYIDKILDATMEEIEDSLIFYNVIELE